MLMRKWLWIVMVLLTMIGCGQRNKDRVVSSEDRVVSTENEGIGVQMLETLNQQGLSLLIYNDSTLTTHDNRGVRDLLTLVATQPARLQGAIVADKIIGKAAAALMATGGVIEVHTNIICTPARELLEREGIRVYATQEVPQILNRDKSHMCPIDSQLEGIESIEECVQILQNIPPVI